MEQSKALAKYREFRPAWKSFLPYFLGVVIFTVGPRVNPQAPISPDLSHLIATCFLAFILITRFSNLYELADGRLRWRRSFPRAQERQAPVERITRIDLRRGIFHRLAGVAHVYVYLDNQPDPYLKLFGVPEPEELRRLLLDLGASDQRVTGAWRK